MLEVSGKIDGRLDTLSSPNLFITICYFIITIAFVIRAVVLVTRIYSGKNAHNSNERRNTNEENR